MGTNIINDYIAGAVGGAAGLVVGHPFDTTKVQLQIKQMKTPYSSTWAAMKSINKQGWVRGFYRGMGFPLASYGLVNSVFFGVYGSTIKWCKGENHQRGVRYNEVFLAGCIGGFAQLFVACPVDLVKVVLQSQIATKAGAHSAAYFRGPAQTCAWIVRRHGIRGLYHGMTSMAYRDIPTFGVYMLVYEFMFDQFTARRLTDRQGVVASLVAGGCSGVACWTLAIPWDNVKSILQADTKQSQFSGTWSCVRQIFQHRGVSGFFTGWLVTCLRAFPVNAATFLFYSQCLRYLNDESRLEHYDT